MFSQWKRKKTLGFHLGSCVLSIVLSLNMIFPMGVAWGQTILNLPVPGVMVPVSSEFVPVIIRGLRIHPDNSLKFNFIVDTGHSGLSLESEAFKSESTKMIKYFLASLTVPEKELWVNLSPYEKDRIVSDGLGKTEMGRDLLAQDYLLKQLTASLIYPEDDLGHQFWRRVYEKAFEKYGTTDIPINTFNKVWIVPDKGVVYEQEGMVFVIERHLKVMLEEDYVALQASRAQEQGRSDVLPEADAKVLSGVSSQAVREILIPEIEREVNEGENFAPLRQIYNSMILATWYKKNLKESLLGQIYFDKNKTKGVDVEDKQISQRIYNQYLEAFKKGVYNYLREDYDQETQQITPKKYFSGGMNMNAFFKDQLKTDRSMAARKKAAGLEVGKYGNTEVFLFENASEPLGSDAAIKTSGKLRDMVNGSNGKFSIIDLKSQLDVAMAAKAKGTAGEISMELTSLANQLKKMLRPDKPLRETIKGVRSLAHFIDNHPVGNLSKNDSQEIVQTTIPNFFNFFELFKGKLSKSNLAKGVKQKKYKKLLTKFKARVEQYQAAAEKRLAFLEQQEQVVSQANTQISMITLMALQTELKDMLFGLQNQNVNLALIKLGVFASPLDELLDQISSDSNPSMASFQKILGDTKKLSIYISALEKEVMEGGLITKGNQKQYRQLLTNLKMGVDRYRSIAESYFNHRLSADREKSTLPALIPLPVFSPFVDRLGNMVSDQDGSDIGRTIERMRVFSQHIDGMLAVKALDLFSFQEEKIYPGVQIRQETANVKILEYAQKLSAFLDLVETNVTNRNLIDGRNSLKYQSVLSEFKQEIVKHIEMLEQDSDPMKLSKLVSKFLRAVKMIKKPEEFEKMISRGRDSANWLDGFIDRPIEEKATLLDVLWCVKFFIQILDTFQLREFSDEEVDPQFHVSLRSLMDDARKIQKYAQSLLIPLFEDQLQAPPSKQAEAQPNRNVPEIMELIESLESMLDSTNPLAMRVMFGLRDFVPYMIKLSDPQGLDRVNFTLGELVSHGIPVIRAEAHFKVLEITQWLFKFIEWLNEGEWSELVKEGAREQQPYRDVLKNLEDQVTKYQKESQEYIILNAVSQGLIGMVLDVQNMINADQKDAFAKATGLLQDAKMIAHDLLNIRGKTMPQVLTRGYLNEILYKPNKNPDVDMSHVNKILKKIKKFKAKVKWFVNRVHHPQADSPIAFRDGIESDEFLSSLEKITKHVKGIAVQTQQNLDSLDSNKEDKAMSTSERWAQTVDDLGTMTYKSRESWFSLELNALRFGGEYISKLLDFKEGDLSEFTDELRRRYFSNPPDTTEEVYQLVSVIINDLYKRINWFNGWGTKNFKDFSEGITQDQYQLQLKKLKNQLELYQKKAQRYLDQSNLPELIEMINRESYINFMSFDESFVNAQIERKHISRIIDGLLRREERKNIHLLGVHHPPPNEKKMYQKILKKILILFDTIAQLRSEGPSSTSDGRSIAEKFQSDLFAFEENVKQIQARIKKDLDSLREENSETTDDQAMRTSPTLDSLVIQLEGMLKFKRDSVLTVMMERAHALAQTIDVSSGGEDSSAFVDLKILKGHQEKFLELLDSVESKVKKSTLAKGVKKKQYKELLKKLKKAGEQPGLFNAKKFLDN